MPADARTVAHSALWNVAGRAGPILIALIVTPSLLHALGPSRWGVFTIALSLVGIFGIFDFGIGRALTRLVAELASAGETERAASLVMTGLAILGGLGLAGTVVSLALAGPWVDQALRIPAALRGEVLLAIEILCLSAPLVIVNAALWGVIAAYQKFRIGNLINVPIMAMYYIGPLLLLQVWDSLVGVMLILVACRLVVTIGSLWVCLRAMPALRRARPRQRDIRPLLRLGSWMTVSAVAWPLLTYMDRFVIASVLSAAAAGVYATPFDLVMRLSILTIAINTSAYPAMAASFRSEPAHTVRLAERSLLAIMAAIFPVGLGAVSRQSNEQPAHTDVPRMTVSRFLDSLGVDAHLEYTDGKYANAAEAVSDLDYLGIHRLRDGVPNPAGGIPYRNYLTSLDQVMQAGNMFDFVVEPGSLGRSLGQIDQLVRAHPGGVIAVEGPNEINNWPVTYKGLKGEDAARAFQHALFLAVHADPHLGKVRVYDYTGGARVDLRSDTKLADDANGHPYPYWGEIPGPRLAQEFAAHFSMTPPYPKVITETGYSDASPAKGGVDDATMAKLTLDLVLDAAREGFTMTYLYQLRSAYQDPRHDNTDVATGLFAYDNEPKPVAVGLHNLTTTLSTGREEDTDLPAARTAPRLQINGLPRDGSALLLTAPGSIFDLVLWAEPRIWDPHAHHPLPAPKTTVSVAFAVPFARAAIFDPTVGARPIATSGLGLQLSVDLSDHPVIVQFKIIPRAT